MTVTAKLLLLLAGHLVLTGLPGAAAALLAARQGVRSRAGAAGDRAWRPAAPSACSASGPTTAAACWANRSPTSSSSARSGWSSGAWPSGRIDRGAAAAAWRRRWSLWALGSVFLVLLGFVHGGTDAPMVTSTTRFSHHAAQRQRNPLLLRRMVLPPRPPAADRRIFPGEWLVQRPAAAADRLRALSAPLPRLGRQRASATRCSGVVLQQLWIVGLWALLLAARVRPLTRGAGDGRWCWSATWRSSTASSSGRSCCRRRCCWPPRRW